MRNYSCERKVTFQVSNSGDVRRGRDQNVRLDLRRNIGRIGFVIRRGNSVCVRVATVRVWLMTWLAMKWLRSSRFRIFTSALFLFTRKLKDFPCIRLVSIFHILTTTTTGDFKLLRHKDRGNLLLQQVPTSSQLLPRPQCRCAGPCCFRDCASCEVSRCCQFAEWPGCTSCPCLSAQLPETMARMKHLVKSTFCSTNFSLLHQSRLNGAAVCRVIDAIGLRNDFKLLIHVLCHSVHILTRASVVSWHFNSDFAHNRLLRCEGFGGGVASRWGGVGEGRLVVDLREGGGRPVLIGGISLSVGAVHVFCQNIISIQNVYNSKLTLEDTLYRKKKPLTETAIWSWLQKKQIITFP